MGKKKKKAKEEEEERGLVMADMRLRRRFTTLFFGQHHFLLPDVKRSRMPCNIYRWVDSDPTGLITFLRINGYQASEVAEI